MNKVLFVIDYQNDFVNGSLGFDGAQKLDEGIAEKIIEYGMGNVYYTMDTHFDDYLETREGKHLPIKHCIKGTTGWNVFGKTAAALKQVNATAVEKNCFGIDLNSCLVQQIPKNVASIELVGLVSNICVISNAVILQNMFPLTEIIVDAKLTASFDDELNKKALDVMEGMQIKVLKTEEN